MLCWIPGRCRWTFWKSRWTRGSPRKRQSDRASGWFGLRQPTPQDRIIVAAGCLLCLTCIVRGTERSPTFQSIKDRHFKVTRCDLGSIDPFVCPQDRIIVAAGCLLCLTCIVRGTERSPTFQSIKDRHFKVTRCDLGS